MKKHAKHVLETAIILAALFVVLFAPAGCDNLLERPESGDSGLERELDNQENPGSTEKSVGLDQSANADDPANPDDPASADDPAKADNPAKVALVVLRGSVATSDGSPADGAAVSLATGEAMYGGSVANGAYTVFGVPAGTYTLTVNLGGYKTFRQYLAVGGEDARQDIYLVDNQARAYIVDGKITAANGGAVGSLALALTTAEGAAVGSVNIDAADGVYWIEEVPAGDYVLKASMAGYKPVTRNISVENNATGQNLYFETPDTPVYTVGGKITVGGSLDGLAVTLTSSHGAVYTAVVSGDRYTVSGVSTGEYTLAARLTGRTVDPVPLNVSSDISDADIEILTAAQFDYTTNGASGLFASAAAAAAGRTTAINIQFNAPVLGLTADDITLEASEWLSISKVSLSGGNGGKDYTLNVTVTGTESGGVKVSVAEKAGYRFTPVRKIAPVYTANTLPAAPTWTLVPAGVGPGTTDVGGFLYRNVNTKETWSGGVEFKDITYGNGRFVAVGDYQTMTTSPDGVNWTAVSFPITGTLTATQGPSGIGLVGQPYLPAGCFWTVNYLNGLFLAALRESTELKYSTDGLNWEGYSVGAGVFGMDYDPVGGNYVLVGHMCKVMYSNNPRSPGSWVNANTGVGTKNPVFAGGSYYVYDVANDGKGTMIAVGSGLYNVNNGNDARMGISRDSGRTWTRVDLSGSSLNSSFIFKIYYQNGKWFAYGTGGGRAWSVDGETWWDLPNFGGYTGFAYGGGIYVAGSGDNLVYSANGTAWAPIQNTGISAIAYGNGKFVAVTGGGEILYSSNVE